MISVRQTIAPRYSWTNVESGIKDHIPNPEFENDLFDGLEWSFSSA
jgi:hypothetical protein